MEKVNHLSEEGLAKLRFDIGQLAFNLSRSFDSKVLDVYAFNDYFLEE